MLSSSRRQAVRKVVLVAIGLLLAASVLVFDSELHHFEHDGTDYGSRPARAAAVAVLMAFWWITEAVSIYWTACIPLVLFPVLGVFGQGMEERLVEPALHYTDAYIFLFLGGMGIAAAMQQWNLHRRMALNILLGIGTQPGRILAGMIVATAFISMWISNTATSAMMLPIGLALIAQIERQSGGQRRELFGGALMLAIAYGANVGGMGTKIGTGPNAIFCGFVSDKLPEHLQREVSFLDFLALGLPFMLLFLPLVWLVLWISGRRDAPRGDIGKTVIEEQLAELGPMSRAEVNVLIVFATTALLWVLSSPITSALKPTLAPIYKEFFAIEYKGKHLESTVSILAVFALLLLPSGERGPTLRLGQLRVIPWKTLILIGGGFSLARGIDDSGLSNWMGGWLAFLGSYPLLIQFLGVCLFTVFFGAIASNVATITVMLFVLRSAVAEGAGAATAVPLMAAATLSASCDFMLPAGTPPNAIVFGSGYLTIPRMARTGFILDLTAAILLALWGYYGITAILR
jgi:sodium-dependent dicarboxylate transporter 2/3/5